MSSKRAFSTAVLVFVLATLAFVQPSCSKSPSAYWIVLNDLPVDSDKIDVICRWGSQSVGAHVSMSMSIQAGEEVGHYQVELTYSHCLGTQIQIATRDAHVEDGRLILGSPFAYDDMPTSVGVDHEAAPWSERTGTDAFRVVTLNRRTLLIPEHYFEHGSVRYSPKTYSFVAFIPRDAIDDPERLARIPADSEYEIIYLEPIFYHLPKRS